MRKVYKKLLKTKNRASPSRGKILEETGVLLELKNPRARLSRTESRGNVFSRLGELLWYLSGKNDLEFISYYLPSYKKDSEDNKTIYGGYGPRIFNTRGQNQIDNVLRILEEKHNSRRAVIQLFDSDDLATPHKEIPCTCTVQFLIRKNKLDMFTHMRSNDAYIGLPHDVFCFTMLQEILARSLSVELGTYKHSVVSLHLYEKNIGGANQYLEEGWQSSKISMPVMPTGDPWEAIKVVLKVESDIRGNVQIDLDKLNIEPYWADLVRLLQVLRYFKNKEISNIVRIKKEMSTHIYSAYIEKKQKKNTEAPPIQVQLDIPTIQ